MIGLDDLPDSIVVFVRREHATPRADAAGGYFALRDQHLAKFERQYLSDLLRRHDGDVKVGRRRSSTPARHALSAAEEPLARRREIPLAACRIHQQAATSKGCEDKIAT